MIGSFLRKEKYEKNKVNGVGQTAQGESKGSTTLRTRVHDLVAACPHQNNTWTSL